MLLDYLKQERNPPVPTSILNNLITLEIIFIFILACNMKHLGLLNVCVFVFKYGACHVGEYSSVGLSVSRSNKDNLEIEIRLFCSAGTSNLDFFLITTFQLCFLE